MNRITFSPGLRQQSSLIHPVECLDHSDIVGFLANVR